MWPRSPSRLARVSAATMLAGAALMLATGAPAFAATERPAHHFTGSLRLERSVAAAAASSWALQKTVSPGSFADSLNGVTCTSAKACVAVGWFAPQSSLVPMAEAWNGTSWAVQPLPNPVGTKSGQLNSVSCAAANFCMAVGSYTSASTPVTLAETWNGRTWSPQFTPNPSGSTGSYLSSVSCTASNFCVAVGGYGTSSTAYLTLAEVWNGSDWTIESTPDPGVENTLKGVSCTGANACVAVGFGAGASALVEQLSGSVWSVMSTPAVPDSLSGLNSVTCTAATSCVAAGDYENTTVVGPVNDLTLAEIWNGSSWSVLPTPSPTDNSNLNALSCTAENSCVAVGYYVNSASDEVALTEVWNGIDWVIEPAPSSVFSLDGTWCTAFDACIAIAQNSKTLNVALVWNGTDWATQSTAVPSADSFLNDVSCAALNACVAVGSYYDFYQVTLAETWNGTRWATRPTPNPKGATTSELVGVSCAAANACMAVGLYWNGSAYQTLAERWNGTRWTIVATPDPSASGSELFAVSCTTANACVAVGTQLTSSTSTPELTLAEVWNGTKWALQTTPNESGASLNDLGGVSCTALKACEAVGSYAATSGVFYTLAEAWNGTKWAIQATPNPSGGTANSLGSVSCTAAKACVSVGAHSASSTKQVTLAELWNGSKWSIRSTPNPAGATESALGAVTCIAADSCVSVGDGYHANTGVQLTLAEAWNGSTWSIRATPNPAGATTSALEGVSCKTAATCVAVGTYSNLAGDSLTFGEADG